jgi:hypothetical protein
VNALGYQMSYAQKFEDAVTLLVFNAEELFDSRHGTCIFTLLKSAPCPITC